MPSSTVPLRLEHFPRMRKSWITIPTFDSRDSNLHVSSDNRVLLTPDYGQLWDISSSSFLQKKGAAITAFCQKHNLSSHIGHVLRRPHVDSPTDT